MNATTATATPVRTIRVDWWYRHASDTEQTIRQWPQMCSAIADTAELARTIAELREQGYSLQRVTLQPICMRCEANGRIIVRRYKRQPPKYATCPTCKGDGHIGAAIDYPI